MQQWACYHLVCCSELVEAQAGLLAARRCSLALGLTRWGLSWKPISRALGEIFNLFLLTVASAEQMKMRL